MTTYVEVSCFDADWSGSGSTQKEYQAGKECGLDIELHIVELVKLVEYIESSE